MIFASVNEAVSAYQRGTASLHARVVIPARALNKTSFTDKQQEALLVTTVGRIIFNEIFPSEFPYINEPTKRNLFEGTPDLYFIHEKARIFRRFSRAFRNRAR